MTPKLYLPSANPPLFRHLSTIGVSLGGVFVAFDGFSRWTGLSTTPPLSRGLGLSLDDSAALSRIPPLCRRLTWTTPPLFLHLSSTMNHERGVSLLVALVDGEKPLSLSRRVTSTTPPLFLHLSSTMKHAASLFWWFSAKVKNLNPCLERAHVDEESVHRVERCDRSSVQTHVCSRRWYSIEDTIRNPLERWIKGGVVCSVLSKVHLAKEFNALQVPVFGSSWSADKPAEKPTDRRERRTWTPSEDAVLISSWIAAYYAASPKVAPGEEREASNCKQRWHKINDLVSKFSGSYEAATREKTSGQNEVDVLKHAHEIFYNIYKKKFTLEHAWKKLRND
uniref:Myb-like domain-containing protein n=1 Tax=Brassica oleracea TaxID=3712 RepID=A0A3P6FC72_BRAOL|nr:unnamed protein product [Brassica oleracea]